MLVPIGNTLPEFKKPIKIVVAGSTGSIGCSALELVRNNRGHFEVIALVAGKNFGLLAHQIKEFRPRHVGMTSREGVESVKQILPSSFRQDTNFVAGDEECAALTTLPDADVILAAIVGVAGLRSVLAALSAGKRVALANKESLVAAGALVQKILERSGGHIIPVDSEHSALFQALLGHNRSDVASLILTASGGPFLNTPEEKFSKIQPEEAVKHPKWNMGSKISVDSATLVNKALELIEASWLFGVPEERIQVVIHPQSIVHSLVEYIDGTQIAQLSVPDMKGAIAFALSWPGHRVSSCMQRLSLHEVGSLSFEILNTTKFPAVGLAREALRQGGGVPAVFNMANEVAVAAFLGHRAQFSEIIPTIEAAMKEFSVAQYNSFEDLLLLQNEAFLFCQKNLSK